ncbi:aminoglycoside phosphotransferase family protein [Paenibacillus segetis]|uniref:Aminoglycoside phosphotransferase n=1 Tax=Paenibacillus segetis TaxID=1325360 RepID=A0ABQ1YJV8_9BACL|nr:phosphotransferase [Paenibacillus segetis]GGH26889.1 aminoglycoside phosphotransferase [Paenibacillus segetis]
MDNTNNLLLLKEHIPFLHGQVQINQINKGYSSDSKFILVKDNQKFLLRTFDYKNYHNKQTEYEALIKMEEFNVSCSRPLEMGSLQDFGIGFMILSFIEGNDAAEDLPTYSMADQYNIGFTAGKELLKIHQYVAPTHITAWYDRKLSKHNYFIDEYFKGEVRIKDDIKILSFIDDNLHYMKHRPNIFQHHDFHVGNLIVQDRELSGIIDFNRLDWGDPVHDFLKTGFFSSEVSIPFSVGQIRGYHNNQDPNDLFWRLYSLYLAMNLISSVSWVIRVKPEETNTMLEKIYRVLEDHHYFEFNTPRWYMENL